MAKNIEDIIVPERKRSIRDIPIPANRKRTEPHFPSPESLQDIKSPYRPSTPTPPPPPPPPTRPEMNPNYGPRKSRKTLWVSIGIGVVVLLFALLTIFNGATLSYVPKSQALTFENDVFVAEKSGTGLIYSLVKLSKDKGVEVSASGEQEVSRKASGTIVVYNNASTEPQQLVENTRFQTPEGLVYRIPKAIVIPGKKGTQPGSIETTVTADAAGELYNIGLTDFSLPGLKGTARYETIYARSKTPMTGGLVGKEYGVSEADKKKAIEALQTSLREELIAEAKAQVPEDFILIPALATVTFEELPQTPASTQGKVTLNLKGELQAPGFKRVDLSNRLARDFVNLSDTEAVDIDSLDALHFALATGTPATNLLSQDALRFNVTGPARVVWRTDEVALKADLVGKKKGDINGILNNYPSIVSATATTRPFWNSSFPTDAAKITIKKLPVQ